MHNTAHCPFTCRINNYMTSGMSKIAMKYLYSFKDLGHKLIFFHFRNDFFIHLKADLLCVDDYGAWVSQG